MMFLILKFLFFRLTVVLHIERNAFTVRKKCSKKTETIALKEEIFPYFLPET